MPQKSLPHNRITRLRDRFRQFFTPSPLLKALEQMGMPQGPTTSRQKARLLVQAIEQDTQACIREQRHLIGYGAADRLEALRVMAENLMDSDWCPKGLSKSEIAMIGNGLIEDVVWTVANGHSIAPLEAKIYELFQLESEKKNLPPMRELQRDGRERSRLRPRPRVRV